MVAALLQQRLEPLGVDRAGLDVQQVPARHRLDRALAERLSQLRDEHLQVLSGGGRRSRPPQPVDQPVSRDGAVGIDQERSDQHALLARWQRSRAVLITHVEPSEHVVPEHRTNLSHR
jgi:hypothetical protein